MLPAFTNRQYPICSDMMTVMKLDLRAPLFYRKELSPPALDDGERIILYDLNPPNVSHLGKAEFSAGMLGGGEEISIPQGIYLFAQLRATPESEIQIALATEVHHEGIRRGLALENRLYIRILIEEAGPVTQIFRPLQPNGTNPWAY